MYNGDATPSMKMADLIESNCNLLEVLSRLDIGLGFGEKTIAEACAECGVNLSSFLLLCDGYTVENYAPSSCAGCSSRSECTESVAECYAPSAELLATADAKDIVKYLKNSHYFYVHGILEELGGYLSELMSCSDALQMKIVNRFFLDFKQEVENHFNYEETVLFAYIENLLSGKREGGYSVDTIVDNHNSIIEKLGDLKSIVMKYLPSSCDKILRSKALSHIFYLESDLSRHMFIENEILIPLVSHLEGHEF